MQYEVREGFPGDAALTLVTETVIENPVGIQLSEFVVDKTSANAANIDLTANPNAPIWHRVETKKGPNRARLNLSLDRGL